MEAHERERGGLVERLQVPQSFRVPDGRRKSPALLEQSDHPTQPIHQEIVQPAPKGFDPLVVALRQQIAPIELDAGGEGCAAGFGADGGFELVHVEHHRCIVDPPYHLTACLDEAVRVRNRGSHVVNQLSEVGEGLRLGGFGPEQESEMPPIDWSVTVQQEIGQERALPGAGQDDGPTRRCG